MFRPFVVSSAMPPGHVKRLAYERTSPVRSSDDASSSAYPRGRPRFARSLGSADSHGCDHEADVIRALRRAGWWIADYAYAVYWQLRAAVDRRDAGSFVTGSRVPIVILPGVYETWRFMQPLITALHARGHPVHVLDSLRHNRRPVAESAQLMTEFLEAAQLTDALIVAHSKGGLAGKMVMAGPAGFRVRAMVAVATPFGGSRYARMLPVRSLRAFSPSDPSIMQLAHRRDVNERIVSIYGEFDPHIPEGSELGGAMKNVRLETGGHFRILANPRVLAEVAALSER